MSPRIGFSLPAPCALILLAALSGTAFPGCMPDTDAPAPVASDQPRLLDDRLELTLFAADPDIVTPIGLAIDDRDRLFVLESHTHTPPSDYGGPTGDQVKRFTDHDGDGRFDSVAVFAEGIEDGMNLAFSPDGTLYVATARSVLALHDRDGDGLSEGVTTVLNMVRPDYVYDHAGILGITFSTDGWMYVSRGNTGGTGWRLEGRSGVALEGYGDGGNIMRSRPDGSELEEVATGFWNPFDLKFDATGRLLAIDNDPDSRGPNRLLDIIPGGDYGYKSLYGGSGIHPYLAWNGELPGTLPFAAGLGEAPSGLLAPGLAALPPDYARQALCTIWEEHTVSRIRLDPLGVSLTGTPEPLIEGGEDFHPVALAADSKGAVYITDWMIRAYPNHGRGRIWRLAARPGTDVAPPRDPSAPPEPDAGRDALARLYAADADDFDLLREALRSDDPFIRTAAVTALQRPVFEEQVLAATRDNDASIRMGALLALQRTGHAPAEPVARRLLSDPDSDLRRMALVWIGRATLTDLRPNLETALTAGRPSPELFETYLATVRHLQPDFAEGYRSRTDPQSRRLPLRLPERFIETFVQDDTRPADLRATALTYLDHPEENVGLLVGLVRDGEDAHLRREAVRTLARAPSPESAALLLAVARDPQEDAGLRADALLALATQPGNAAEDVIALVDDDAPSVQIEAVRYLRVKPPPDTLRAALEATNASIRDVPDQRPLYEQLAFVLRPPVTGTDATGRERPEDPDAWAAAVATGGNAESGRRVFYAPQSQCSLCHAIQRRGGDLGPDLTNVGRSKNRNQIVRSILRPSEDIAPDWQGWYVETTDGQTHYGRQIDVSGSGDQVELYTATGGFETYTNVASFGVAEASLMPNGLEAQLTVSDFRDLVAFLTRTATPDSAAALE